MQCLGGQCDTARTAAGTRCGTTIHKGESVDLFLLLFSLDCDYNLPVHVHVCTWRFCMGIRVLAR